VKQILIPALGPLPHLLIPLQATLSLKPTRFDGKVGMDYQNFNLPIVRAMAVITVESPIQNHSTL